MALDSPISADKTHHEVVSTVDIMNAEAAAANSPTLQDTKAAASDYPEGGAQAWVTVLGR